MTDHSFTDADHAAVTSATKILFSRYRKYVDFQDVQQTLYLWLLQHYEKVITWRANYSERHAERTVIKALRNAGERYCRTEKAERDGYAVEDEFFYSIPMIADLLSLSFDPLWRQPKGVDYSEQRPTSPSNDLVVMVSDVTSALETLPKPDQTLLRYVYGGKRTPSEAFAQLGLDWDISPEASYHRVRRVVGRVRAALGGENPWRDIA
jgi:hypothetical protein